MISFVQGVVNLVNSNEGTASIVTNSGVGYLIHIGCKNSQFLHIGENISFFIETIVKEDSINLYGFKNYEQQLVFNSLLKVSGVGAKVAMNILDNLSLQEIIDAIISENPSVFQKISGLGEKVSSRIVAESKKEPAKNAKILALCKIGTNSTNLPQTQSNTTYSITNITKDEHKNSVKIQDITSALVNLGFEYNRSFTTASNVIKTSKTIEEAIFNALKEINQ
jgi:Holliday junction DNA helicase RuvA subunit